ANLKTPNARPGTLALLKLRHPAPSFARGAADLVQFRVVAGPNQAAFTQSSRWIVGEGILEYQQEVRRRVEVLAHRNQPARGAGAGRRRSVSRRAGRAAGRAASRRAATARVRGCGASRCRAPSRYRPTAMRCGGDGPMLRAASPLDSPARGRLPPAPASSPPG